MADTTQKSDTLETQAALPRLFSTRFIDSAESMLQAQVDLLAEMEEALVGALRAQQQALQKVLDVVAEARGGNSLADQVKLQLAVSEQCFNTGVTLWRDMAIRFSERTLNRIEAGRKMAAEAANSSEETPQPGSAAAEKSSSSSKGARRNAAEAA